MRRSLKLLVSLLLSSVAVATAQSCPPRYVIVNVLDAQGMPISDLTAMNFKASSQGKSLRIPSASFRTDPGVRTVVLLKAKGYGEAGAGRVATAAAAEFISSAAPQAPVSMFAFSSAIEHSFNSSGGRQPMQDWLNSPETAGLTSHKGGSDLHQTLLTILNAMKPAHPGDAIYVITNDLDRLMGLAQETGGPPITSDIAAELQSSGVRLFALKLEVLRRRRWAVILPGDNMMAVPRPPMGSEALADLVRSSGGLGLEWYPSSKSVSFAASYDFDSITQAAIRKSARAFQAAISNFYILTVDPPEGSSALGDWKLEIVDPQGRKRKDVVLAYPGKIGACTALTAGP